MSHGYTTSSIIVVVCESCQNFLSPTSGVLKTILHSIFLWIFSQSFNKQKNILYVLNWKECKTGLLDCTGFSWKVNTGVKLRINEWMKFYNPSTSMVILGRCPIYTINSCKQYSTFLKL